MFPEIVITMATSYVIITIAMGDNELVMVDRAGWNARPPVKVNPMKNPVPFVVIHHSYIPAACETKDDCVRAMQWMQDYHQNNHSWNDIGYHFAVGGDGNVYEGRGWSSVGAHSPGYNDKGIGICVIGDWTTELPPIRQLRAVNDLITFGVANGYIKANYGLIGHRQVRDTECPGDRLFKEIMTWKNFLKNPKKPYVLQVGTHLTNLVHGRINKI